MDICVNWLNSKQTGSVVYVSFGSLETLGEDQMEHLVMGLKRSQRNFLWVVRETEQIKILANFIEETLEKGLVVAWSPQLQVLAHEAVGIRAEVDGKGIIRKEEIERCIREIMEGDRGGDIKRNAVKWKKLAMEAVNEGGSSDTNITEFIAELTAKDHVSQLQLEA
ncbi:hypothetical protein V6N13_099894 [Hibiscus sabdariffa]|uniref:Uncharacterized protein n=1 Tax=Hibiscus sabdariffa TaxID=183260 RepID=A0ABR2NL77_9ROSI